MQDDKVKIFSSRSSRYLAEKISKEYGLPLGMSDVIVFSDGEFQPSFEESVRGCRVFLIASTFPNSDNLMELLMMIDSAKRASAKHVTVVIPYFGWARQDRKDKPRVPITSRLVSNMLSVAGATRIITMDLHADQIQGFFDIPVDHLYSSTIFFDYIKRIYSDKLVIASPDMGGSKRAYAYTKNLNNSDVVICYKQRKKANEIDNMMMIGEVEGKDVILVDDIIDTGKTIVKAANIMIKNGASTVRAIITHPVLSGNAIEIIENSELTELVTTDSIPLRRESNKIKVLSCSKLFADVMKSVHNHESISNKFIF